MPAPATLYQELYQRIATLTAELGMPKTAVKRLALLVVGVVAAQGVTLARVADELLSLGLTRATQADSIKRTLGRILGDERLDPRTWFEPALAACLDWAGLLQGSKRLLLAVDESSKRDQVHLLRVGLPYWGHCQPLVWDIWPQNRPLAPANGYWQRVDAVLARAATLVPGGLQVTVLADRAYDIPAFIDRLGAFAWHWAVRLKAKASTRFRDYQGREWPVKALLRQHLWAPGMRWKCRGWLFKEAGWREASIVAYWAFNEDEPLVVISDLPPRWDLLRLYGSRFWIEPGFRSDKQLGWHWEACQVKKLAHQERLLLAMAWATLLTLCLGLAEAKARLSSLKRRRVRTKHGQPFVGEPRHAEQSLFTMGLRRSRDWFYGIGNRAIHWLLSELDADSWQRVWYHYQSQRYLSKTVRP
jgi:hypothetical protein